MKKCSMCKETLPATEFSKALTLSGGLNSRCKPCDRVHKSQWRKLNPDKHARTNARHRAHKLGAEGSHTAEEWQKLRDSYGKCLCCGRIDVPLTEDHIVAITNGGSDDISNIQPLCGPCNSSKGNKTIDYRSIPLWHLIKSPYSIKATSVS